MSNLADELVFLVLQYFNEENLSETALTLGRESRLYFDLKYFEEMVLEGKWDDAEKYLSGFSKFEDNNDHTIKIYFELRKQKYLEALDRNDRHMAVDILVKDLKVFAPVNEQMFAQLTHLLTVKNIREVEQLSTYQDATSERKKIADNIKKIIVHHPVLSRKLTFPAIRRYRLRELLNESCAWLQHQNPVEGPPASQHALLINNLYHPRPTNPEAALMVLRDPNEMFRGRPFMVSDKDKNDRERDLMELQLDSIEESHKLSKNLIEISIPSQCRFNLLAKQSQANKIVKLSYTNAGNSILALESNGTHLLWDAKAPTQACPQMWLARNNKFMTNDLTNTKGIDSVSCFAISKKDAYLVSTSGGFISLFNMVTLKTLSSFLPPPPMVTCLVFVPQDNNVLAVGLDDSSILIYHILKYEVQMKLKGHSKRVTALAFSNTLNVLVSADANAQIVVWNVSKWEKLRDRSLQIPGQNVPERLSETQIQLHPNQQNFLVVHNSHLAIYEATELKCVNQWDPKVSVVISQATFSSDGQMVYACFVDGTLAIFDASNFQLYCRIHTSAYLSPSSVNIHPTVIAAHPKNPNQFAAGLTDGSVYLFEPPESNWNIGSCLKLNSLS